MSFLYKSRKGVSGLEYLGIITLIMTGILLGGPYVMRGINAPFKALEDGALDSAREDIRQSGSVALPPCSCTGLEPAGCGDGGTCAQTSALHRRSCSPLGCEVDLIAANLLVPPIMEQCLDDPTNTCCLPASSTGNCGPLASNVPGGCPAGEMEKAQVCGSPVPVTNYFCDPDPACIGGCQPYGLNVAGWCDPVNYELNVIGSMPPRIVDSGHCGDDPDMRCKAQCIPTAYASGSTCILRCGNGICEDGTAGQPDFGETNATCAVDCAAPPTCVAHAVDGGPFSALMNQLAMWVGPANDDNLYQDANTAFVADFTIPADGFYTIELGIDNYGHVEFDSGPNECVVTSDDNSYSWPTLRVCSGRFFTAGNHTATIRAVNRSGGGGDWGSNPGGVGFRLSQGSTVIISSIELGRWQPFVEGDPNYCLPPEPDPDPDPVGAVCGDGICEAGEALTCFADCDLNPGG